MIVCTHCGAQNPDDAENCVACGKKLQSRRARVGSRNDAAEGAEPAPWRAMEPLRNTAADAQARRLVRDALKTLAYAGILIAGAAATMLTENWWYAGCCAALVAGLAALQKI